MRFFLAFKIYGTVHSHYKACKIQDYLSYNSDCVCLKMFCYELVVAIILVILTFIHKKDAIKIHL